MKKMNEKNFICIIFEAKNFTVAGRGGKNNWFLDDMNVNDSGLIHKSQKSILLNVNWQRNVDRTQEAELAIMAVQRPDSQWCPPNEKNMRWLSATFNRHPLL